MVRADLLDAIDDVLRRYKDYRKPFGGIQLLMIGDLHQLSPVTTEEDWTLLKDYYKSPYFFDSNAWKSTHPITIQLTHIYRQSDKIFIDLLNSVRDNQLNASVLATLNSRYIPNFQAPKEAGYITLTALNRTAQAINEEKLRALKGSTHQFKAKIKGTFPEKSFPTEEILEFKIGAQVLFIKNDGPEKRYYNGKIGQITAITDNKIYVKCPNDGAAICVAPVEWKNRRYSLDEQTGLIKEEEKGVFIQYPLKLAWAITIHKSQGLTFDKAIIDAQNAFTHGQVYVALSRCKNFEGIVLRTPIGYGSVRTDTLIKAYSKAAERNKPDANHLLTAKRKYQEDLIHELFNFRPTRITLNEVMELYLAHQDKLTEAALQQVIAWENKIAGLLFATAAKFEPILTNYFGENQLPEQNEVLMNRIKKAGEYFTLKIQKELLESHRAIPVLTDNKDLKISVETALKNLERTLFIKHHCFVAVEKNGFITQQYLLTKATANIDFEKNYQNAKKNAPLNIPAEVKYPELYKALFYWRNAKAAVLKRKLADVISTKSMIAMASQLPTTKKEMLKINGFGSVKFKTFGKALMTLINDFCYDHKIFPNIAIPPSLIHQTAIANNKIIAKRATNSSTKAYSVAKIRGMNPKAYQPWTETEEIGLVQLQAADKTISYIAGILGRKRGAITARLKRLDDGMEEKTVVFS